MKKATVRVKVITETKVYHYDLTNVRDIWAAAAKMFVAQSYRPAEEIIDIIW